MRITLPALLLLCIGASVSSVSLLAAPAAGCGNAGAGANGICQGDPAPATDGLPDWPKRTDLTTEAAVEQALISPTSAGFGTGSCRAGYYQVGPRLCMTGALGPASLANAMAYCQAIFGSLAGYSEWRYRVLYGDGIMPPVGWWLGPITADNTGLYVNQSVVGDFDGETNRFESRYYVCAHDDEL